jgi:hypothetical protein
MVDPQPPQREGERMQRRRVRPLGIVNEHHDRAVLLQHAKQLHQARASGERIRLLPATDTGGGERLWKRQIDFGEQLVDNPERQGRLLLGAAAPQRPNPGSCSEELVDQRGLADSGRPFDQHQPREGRPGRRPRRPIAGQAPLHGRRTRPEDSLWRRGVRGHARGSSWFAPVGDRAQDVVPLGAGLDRAPEWVVMHMPSVEPTVEAVATGLKDYRGSWAPGHGAHHSRE